MQVTDCNIQTTSSRSTYALTPIAMLQIPVVNASAASDPIAILERPETSAPPNAERPIAILQSATPSETASAERPIAMLSAPSVEALNA